MSSQDSSDEDVKKNLAFVDRPHFTIAMTVIILMNVVTLGLQTELVDRGSSIFAVVNHMFLLIYTAELIVRFLSYGPAALRDRMTVLDLFLVLVAILEGAASNRGLAKALPVFRVVRLIRVLRVFRLARHSRELSLLASSFVKALATLMWVSIFLFLVLWSCAACAQVVIGQSAEWVGSTDPTVNHAPFASFDNRMYFGTVSASLLTFIQVVTLSQWSNHVARPVLQVYPSLFLFFTFFLFATSYGLLMCIISNIVQESMIASRDSDKAIALVEQENKRQSAGIAFNMLKKLDLDGDGLVSASELDAVKQDPFFIDIMKSLGVPFHDSESLIRLLDKSGDGSVSFSEMVEGFAEMGEDLRPRDFAKLSLRVRNLLMRAGLLEEKVQELSRQLALLRRKLEGAFGAVEHFRNTKNSTELRRKALEAARNSLPSDPPLPTEMQPAPKTAVSAMSEMEQFKIFTSRFLGKVPDESDACVATYSLQSSSKREPKATLQPAPPRPSIARREAAERQASNIDKYLGPNCVPTQKLTDLRCDLG